MDFYTRTTVKSLNINLIALNETSSQDESINKKNSNKLKLEPLNNQLPTFINFKTSKFLEDSADSHKSIRIENLEKSIQYLHSQHADILSNLHSEIDDLKRQNRALQLKIAELDSISSFKRLPKEGLEKLDSSFDLQEKMLLKNRIIALEKALQDEEHKNNEYLASLRQKNYSDKISETKKLGHEINSEHLDIRASFPPVIKDRKLKQNKNRENKLFSTKLSMDDLHLQRDLSSIKGHTIFRSVNNEDEYRELVSDRSSSKRNVSSAKPLLRLPPIHCLPNDKSKMPPERTEAELIRIKKNKLSKLNNTKYMN